MGRAGAEAGGGVGDGESEIMSAPRLDEKTKLEILKAYREGEPLLSIADRFKVHMSYPTLLAKRRGLSTRRPSGRKYG